jgi:hypothetical protein
MKSILRIAALALAGTAIFASTASAHMPKTITIRHQMHGCHAWSVAKGPWKTTLKIRVDRDASLVINNDDVMPHRLVQVTGPKAYLFKANMNHMSAQAYVTFSRTGVYTFTTKAGEDYPSMKGMKTIGKDNVLRLKVTVTS